MNTANNGQSAPYVIMRFPVMGEQLTADHGYALFGAVSRHINNFHEENGFGLELISGVSWQPGIIVLPKKGATLSMRLPADACAQVLPLAGKRLDINGYSIKLGIPNIKMLEPSPQLYARMVLIRGAKEAQSLLSIAERQLREMGIRARLEIPRDEQNRFRRRILEVCGRKLVGFSLVAHQLSDEDSIKLQAHGLGGKRHMGCGIFNPIVNGLTDKKEAYEQS